MTFPFGIVAAGGVDPLQRVRCTRFSITPAAALYGPPVGGRANQDECQRRPEIHYTRIYWARRRWQADDYIDENMCWYSAQALRGRTAYRSVIHRDGTTTEAK